MLKYWLAANLVDGIGPIKLKKLLDEHASIEKVCQVVGADLLRAEQEIKKAAEQGTLLLSVADERYPELLKNIYDPPPVLYVKGQEIDINRNFIAIVGTRKASRYGKETARRLGYELASLGFTIVSGLALGIDTEAHWGALEAKGKTIAVFGCGVDHVYPSSNKRLAKEIEASGSLVSEFPLGTGTEKGHFPRRNRIISGLSMGVIVVEGHYDSGAMITAKHAIDEGREVFAVPGNVAIEQSKGPHWLIKNGARLIESVDDVLEEFNMVRPDPKSDPSAPLGTRIRDPNKDRNYPELSDEEQKIVKVLSLEPKHIDNIAIETGLSIPDVSSLLLMLEVKNVIKQLPGKIFILQVSRNR